MSDEKSRKVQFEFTESSLTEFVNQALKLSQPPQGKFWFAACARTDHTSGKTWAGKKRSDRREAIKDAIEHNGKFNHNAGVVGPIE